MYVCMYMRTKIWQIKRLSIVEKCKKENNNKYKYMYTYAHLHHIYVCMYGATQIVHA